MDAGSITVADGFGVLGAFTTIIAVGGVEHWSLSFTSILVVVAIVGTRSIIASAIQDLVITRITLTG
jgi:hypothetical protein